MPAGRGRLRVRSILASRRVSIAWFQEEAPTAARKVPRQVKKSFHQSMGSGKFIFEATTKPKAVVKTTMALRRTLPSSMWALIRDMRARGRAASCARGGAAAALVAGAGADIGDADMMSNARGGI